jgi:hypothetical protein
MMMMMMMMMNIIAFLGLEELSAQQPFTCLS